MKLYHAPLSCSLATRIALGEAGLEAEIVPVELASRSAADGSRFTEVNRKGQVPALVLDDGRVLTEGSAVLQYVADLRPEAVLAPPPGSFERVRLQEWLSFLSTELHKLVFWSIFNPGTPEPHRAYVRTLAPAKLAHVAERLEKGGFLVGDRFGVADAYLFTILNWCGPAGVALDRWPALTDWHARVAQRPAVKAAFEADLALRAAPPPAVSRA